MMKDTFNILVLMAALLSAGIVFAQSAQENDALGILYYKQGKLDDAINNFNDAIKINPRDEKAYNNRGLVYVQLGFPDEAIKDFTKAIEIYPFDAEAYNNRAHIYAKKTDFLKALADSNEAIKCKPAYANAYNLRAIIYYHLKQYDKAQADVEKAEALGNPVSLDFINSLKEAMDAAQSKLTPVSSNP